MCLYRVETFLIVYVPVALCTFKATVLEYTVEDI